MNTATGLISGVLQTENQRFYHAGGISQGNRNQGFSPAFLDTLTGHVYLSRYANGLPAHVHMLEGLPEEVVIERDTSGGVAAVKKSLISGFTLDGKFYTREQAAEFCASIH